MNENGSQYDAKCNESIVRERFLRYLHQIIIKRLENPHDNHNSELDRQKQERFSSLNVFDVGTEN